MTNNNKGIKKANEEYLAYKKDVIDQLTPVKNLNSYKEIESILNTYKSKK